MNQSNTSDYKQEVRNYLNELNSTAVRWETENKEIITGKNNFMRYKALHETSINDLSKLRILIRKIETFYINHKHKLTQELCSELSDVINTLFNNNYKFNFKIDVKRNKKHTILVDEIKNGKASIVCGGAVKQTIAFLSALSILKQKGSNICWLDESFSNFGSDEIKRVPDILSMIGDMQIIFTEHKTEFTPNEGTNIITFTRENSKSAEVNYETQHIIEDIQHEIQDKTVTQEDLDILEQFKYNSMSF